MPEQDIVVIVQDGRVDAHSPLVLDHIVQLVLGLLHLPHATVIIGDPAQNVGVVLQFLLLAVLDLLQALRECQVGLVEFFLQGQVDAGLVVLEELLLGDADEVLLVHVRSGEHLRQPEHNHANYKLCTSL